MLGRLNKKLPKPCEIIGDAIRVELVALTKVNSLWLCNKDVDLADPIIEPWYLLCLLAFDEHIVTNKEVYYRCKTMDTWERDNPIYQVSTKDGHSTLPSYVVAAALKAIQEFDRRFKK